MPESADRVQLLRRLGAGLYGRQWQTALAADLAVGDRTLRRWVAGDWPIPSAAWPRFLGLVEDREVVLRALRDELILVLSKG